MSRGLIVDWTFNSEIDNRGVVAGCSPDVHAKSFAFVIGSVADAGLANFLRTNPHLSITPNCTIGPSVHWVSFDPAGQFAVNIQPAFHGVPDAVASSAGMPAFATAASQPEAGSGSSLVSDSSTGIATSPESLAAHAAAVGAHAEAASRHAEAASLHAKAAEAHAREAARHSTAVNSIGVEGNAPNSNDSTETETSAKTDAGSASAKIKRGARAGAPRKRR